MTLWLMVLAALQEDPRLSPNTHVSGSQPPVAPVPGDLTHNHGLWRQTQRKDIQMHNPADQETQKKIM